MSDSIKLFLAGDVMTGRGVDQVLPRPSDPVLYESYVRDARVYVELTEAVSGTIDSPVAFDYIWGDALTVLEREAPDLRIVNLETSVTVSDEAWPGKGINYRMHPRNVPCLTAAALDCCVLANNHVIDWGLGGLDETLTVLHAAGIGTAGAGRDAEAAAAPAVVDFGERGRVLVFGFAATTSGVPEAWAAEPARPGVNLLPADPREAEAAVGRAIEAASRTGDTIVASIHWGGNWGYAIPREQRELAHALVEHSGVDIVHGHSSHHAKGIEVHGGRPIIYGAGDFINDYEGIAGREEYRGDLRLAYFVELGRRDARVASFEIVPFRSRRFSLEMASDADVEWVRAALARESARFGVRIERTRHDTLRVE